jgi:hypothetical protein
LRFHLPGGLRGGAKACEGQSRGLLLGLLLGGPFGAGEGLRNAVSARDADLDAKAFLVVGAGLRSQDVLGLYLADGLKALL